MAAGSHLIQQGWMVLEKETYPKKRSERKTERKEKKKEGKVVSLNCGQTKQNLMIASRGCTREGEF